MDSQLRFSRSLLFSVAMLGALTACSTFLGLDDITIEEEDDDDNGGPSGATGPGAGAGAGSASATAGSSNQMPMAFADGVYIQSIALYQGTERPLMVGGAAASSDIPIVAGRNALIRIFYTTDANYDGEAILARLTLGNENVVETSAVLGASSSQEQLGSTINIKIDGAQLVQSTSYRVEVLQPAAKSSGTNVAAAYPAETAESLPVQSTGPQLKIVLVPIAYAADGSNRLPDTSAQQLQIYTDTFYSLYPVRQVDVTTTAQITWNNNVSANGSGWGELLNALINFRASNGAAPDEYYYGIFNPKSSFQSYCSGGCVTGLSVQAGPNDAMGRAGIGVGFSGTQAADTAVHEIGHQHGRGHAPCGTSDGVDTAFPHSGGALGSMGYDLVNDALVSPTGHTDFMGYCNPTWVSDYNFKQLFNRIKLVNGANFYYPGWTGPQSFHRISLTTKEGKTGLQGDWLEPIELPTPPTGEALQVTVNTPQGQKSLEGRFLRYSHIDGGILLFRKLAAPARGLNAVLNGQRIHVARTR